MANVIAGYVATAFAYAGASSATIVAVWSATAYAIQTIALGLLSKALSPRLPKGDASINFTVRGTTEYRRQIFGTRRVYGVIRDYTATNGPEANNNELNFLVMEAGHQVSAIRGVWLDNIYIPEAYLDSNGLVTTGQFANHVRITRLLGTSSPQLSTEAQTRFGYDSTYALSGIAAVIVYCYKNDTVFPQGPPQNISALVDGALVYDPRLDTTNGGSGSHRYTDPSTWAFSRNPALIARHILSGGSVVNDRSTPLVLYGLADGNDRINDAYTIAAANVCDEVLTGTEATPDGNDVRYQCDYEASCEQENGDILDAVLESMAGSAVIVHGKWCIRAGAYETPIHTLTDADLYGELKVQDTDTYVDRYNAVSARFVDSAQQYAEDTCLLRTDAAYEALDNDEQIPIELNLQAVTNKWQAQRLSEIHLRKSRMQRRVVFHGALNLLKCALQEGILFTHSRYSWSNRVLRVQDRQFEFQEEAGRVVLTTQRDDSGVWADLLTADYTTGTSATDVFQQDGPSTPLTFTATSWGAAIAFQWTVGSDAQDAEWAVQDSERDHRVTASFSTKTTCETVILIYSERFRRDYDGLAVALQARVERCLEILQENPRHPGLRVKKLKGIEGLWEARVSRSYRIIFALAAHSKIVLLRVGPHDIEENP